MEFEISLNDLIFYSYHGVYEEEQKIGNEFHVSLTVVVPYNEGLEADDLAHTVSYADLYGIIEKEMAISSKLLEKVALKVAKRIKNDFPEIIKGKISIEKKHPPIPGILGSASVTLNF